MVINWTRKFYTKYGADSREVTWKKVLIFVHRCWFLFFNVAIDMVCHFNCKIIPYFQQREIDRETSKVIFSGIRSVKRIFQERSMRMTDAHHIHLDKRNSYAQVCFGETDKTNLQRYILCCIWNISDTMILAFVCFAFHLQLSLTMFTSWTFLFGCFATRINFI